MKIAVIDTVPDLLHALSGRGHSIRTFENGILFLNELKTAYRPDLIIINLMHCVKGMYTLRHLARDIELKIIPIFVISAEEEFGIIGNRPMIKAFFVNPISCDDVVAAVAEFAESGRTPQRIARPVL